MHRAGKKNEARGYDVTGYFLLVMSRLVRAAADTVQENRGEYYVRRAKKIMEDHYGEEISIADVAKSLRLDRTYLYRLFKRYEGISPSDHLRDIRLSAAVKLLENDELSINEAALTAGFCDISHFYKNFTVRYGVSPKQWRESKKETK